MFCFLCFCWSEWSSSAEFCCSIRASASITTSSTCLRYWTPGLISRHGSACSWFTLKIVFWLDWSITAWTFWSDWVPNDLVGCPGTCTGPKSGRYGIGLKSRKKVDYFDLYLWHGPPRGWGCILKKVDLRVFSTLKSWLKEIVFWISWLKISILELSEAAKNDVGYLYVQKISPAARNTNITNFVERFNFLT